MLTARIVQNEGAVTIAKLNRNALQIERIRFQLVGFPGALLRLG